MSVSRPCEHCGDVKRCKMFSFGDDADDSLEERPDGAGTVYLCRPCARELGYVGQAA